MGQTALQRFVEDFSPAKLESKEFAEKIPKYEERYGENGYRSLEKEYGQEGGKEKNRDGGKFFVFFGLIYVLYALEEEDVNLDEVNDWKMRSEHYKKLEKDALLKLETDELERGVKTDEESLFAESDTKIKKERKIEDIFDDPGFLEF